MSWVIYFFGSGAAFFAGVGCVVTGLALVSYFRREWSARASTLLTLIGLILIGLSATPFPYWFYALAAVVTLTWMVAERLRKKVESSRRIWLRILVVVVWTAAIFAEL